MATSSRGPSGDDRERTGLTGGGTDSCENTGMPASDLTNEVDAMAAAWKRGERRLAEEVLARNPGLGDEEAIRVVYEEVCLRQEAGEDSVSAEVLGRFPQWRSKLELLLDGNRLLRTAIEAEFPVPGDVVGDFRIIAEIGRGAVGRTYLASQLSLAQRPVVLKIAALGHDEHLSLARLQHMYIVPLYFEQVVPERNLQILCMPYLGGTTLARILDDLRPVPFDQRAGKHILEALDRHAVAGPTEELPKSPYRKYLAQTSYIQAICWIGACLADALQYAHDRGLVHMDVKASNVLLAGDGQPMLLDFHVARGPIGPDLPAPDRLGGTPALMAPEQREAMAAIRQGRPVTVSVDGRCDIYSLGLLLHEALGGGTEAGEEYRPKPPLEQVNPRVSPGLSDIVRKCLAHQPHDRYPDAASLAIDLRRHMNDLPLRGVPNRSPVERWRKWRRREPMALARTLYRLGIVATILTVLALLFAQFRERTNQINEVLKDSQQQLEEEHYAEATKALNRGLELARRLPARDPRKQALAAALQRVRRATTAQELDELVNLLRFRSGTPAQSPDEAQTLLRRCQDLWSLRRLLDPTADARSDTGTRDRIRTDLLDLAAICADLYVQTGSRAGTDDGLRHAVQILLDAKHQYGSSPALSRDLASYAKAMGRPELAPAEVPIPTTAWEHYDLGRSYLRSGEYARAEQEFRRSVELQPDEFWPNFFQAVCADRLGRYRDAVTALSICIALFPKTPECYFNRGVAYEKAGQDEQALADYSRALKYNPRLADAALNRGLLAYRKKQYTAALRDLEAARASAVGAAALGRIHYNIALVHLARKDVPSARNSLKQAIEYGDHAARQLAARLDQK